MPNNPRGYELARQAGASDQEVQALREPSKKRLTPDQQCGARTQEGSPCKRRKGHNTDHPGYGYCSKHGGATEAGNKAAMREMGRDLATQIKADRGKWGGDRNDPSLIHLTPEQALLEEVRRTAAFVRFLEERIGRWNLTPDNEALIEKFANTPRHKMADMRRHIETMFEELEASDPDSPSNLPPLMTRDRNTGFTSYSDAREWLYLYREERAHLARVAKMCIDAGVAQRMVSIAEDQGRILASAIRAVLMHLNLSPEQAALVPLVVPPILRAVASDSPLPELVLTAPS